MPINDPFKSGGIVDPFKSQQDDWAERVKPDSPWPNWVVGMGRGFADVGQGVQQLFRGDEYDQRVRDEMDLYDRNMDGVSAWLGRFAGNVAATALPSGAAVKGAQVASRGLNLANRLKDSGRVGAALSGRVGAAAGEGAVAGAVENAMLADRGDSGLFGRLAEGAAMGGAFGGLVGAGAKAFDDIRDYPRGLIRGNTPNNPNTLARGRAQAGQAVEDAMRGSGAAGRRADTLQEATGVHLTPADRTGNRFTRFLENMASQSLVSADKVTIGRAKSGRQIVNAARRIASAISPQNDTVQAAQNLQKAVSDMAEGMAKRRTDEAGALYRQVDAMAGNAPVVELSNTERAIKSLMDEYRNTVGADAEQIVSQGARFKKLTQGGAPPQPQIVNPQTGRPFLEAGEAAIGKITASDAMRQLQVWSKAMRGTGKLFDDVSRSEDQRAAKILHDALLSDLDNAAVQGGTVGEMIRNANAAWRKHSQQIDTLENSILGDVVGQEFADEINGIVQNKMTPEKVLDRFRRAAPKEIKVARDYLEKYNPEAWAQIKRAYIDEAVSFARSSTATQQTNVIEPAELIRQLRGGTTRKAAKRGDERLKAMFGGSDEWGQINALIQVLERKADGFGYNSSGTSPQEGARKILGAMYGGGLTALGTMGEVMGLRKIADYMTPGGAPAPNVPLLPYRQTPMQIGGLPVGGLAGFLGTQQVSQGDR